MKHRIIHSGTDIWVVPVLDVMTGSTHRYIGAFFSREEAEKVKFTEAWKEENGDKWGLMLGEPEKVPVCVLVTDSDEE